MFGRFCPDGRKHLGVFLGKRRLVFCPRFTTSKKEPPQEKSPPRVFPGQPKDFLCATSDPHVLETQASSASRGRSIRFSAQVHRHALALAMRGRGSSLEHSLFSLRKPGSPLPLPQLPRQALACLNVWACEAKSKTSKPLAVSSLRGRRDCGGKSGRTVPGSQVTAET